MKKHLIIALALTLVVVAFAASPASADTEPHGGYTTTTDACAGCHRAHTGVGAKLLKSSSIYDLCMSCHGATANGANNDVLDGKEVASGKALKGGGFSTTFMNTSLAGAAPTTAIAATSRHKVNGFGTYAGDIMWGNGAINGTAPGSAGPSVTLECSSCHDPHGKASSTSTATYRILRGTPTGSGTGVTPVNVPDDATKVYVVSDTTNQYYGQQYPDGAVANGKIAVLSAWCATCHTRLHTTSSGNSGDAIYGYRHKTDGDGTNSRPACLTCHVAHGTSAAMGTNSAAVLKPGSTTAMGASLLRIDNRGVCQACHQK